MTEERTHPPDPKGRLAGILADHGAELQRVARGYEREPEKVRDVYQEMCVAIWRALPSYEARASIRTFVFRIAHNVGATHCIRQARSRTSRWVTIEELEAESDRSDVESHVEARRDIDRLHALVETLKPVDRQLVMLFLEGTSTEEIAEITGLGASNVATKLSRVRSVLRKSLTKANPHPNGERGRP